MLNVVKTVVNTAAQRSKLLIPLRIIPDPAFFPKLQVIDAYKAEKKNEAAAASARSSLGAFRETVLFRLAEL